MKEFLLPLSALAFLFAVFIILNLSPQQPGEIISPINPSTTGANLKIGQRKDFSRLLQSYNQILSQTSAEFAITFLDLNTGEEASINAEKAFHAASTTKPFVAVYALRQVEKGKLDFNREISGISLSERLRLMINISDNDSWEELLKFFGISKIQKFSQDLGLANTNHFENTTTTDDLAKFLVKLYQEQILTAENREFLLKLMQKTETEDRIPAGIEAEKLVFHKSGSFEGGIHDVAIVVHPQTPFVLAILSEGKNDLDERPAILAEIAKVSWEFADNQK